MRWGIFTLQSGMWVKDSLWPSKYIWTCEERWSPALHYPLWVQHSPAVLAHCHFKPFQEMNGIFSLCRQKKIHADEHAFVWISTSEQESLCMRIFFKRYNILAHILHVQCSAWQFFFVTKTRKCKYFRNLSKICFKQKKILLFIKQITSWIHNFIPNATGGLTITET